MQDRGQTSDDARRLPQGFFFKVINLYGLAISLTNHATILNVMTADVIRLIFQNSNNEYFERTFAASGMMRFV